MIKTRVPQTAPECDAKQEATPPVRVMLSAEGDPARDYEFEGVILELTPGLLSTIRSVQHHVRSKSMDHLSIEAEPAEWYPRGIDSNLRVTEAQIVVGANDIRFRAMSRVEQGWVNTRLVSIGSLEAAYERAALRTRAMQAA